jgi:outer membrane protein FlgP
MKQVIRSFCQATILLVLLSGCHSTGYNSTTISPGPVLGLDQPGSNSHKVVTFEVIGKGVEPENSLSKGEAKIMAERAAVADGYRQLVEKVRGVYVDAFMKAGFGTVNQDMITTKTQSWLRGVDIVEIRYAEHDITEAVMELSIYFARKDMVWWPRGLGPKLKPVEDYYHNYRQYNVYRSGN